MSAERGIRVFGQEAVDALFRKFTQLNDQQVFGLVDLPMLTGDQKKDALCDIYLIKQKWCGKIKGQTCADGRKQQGLYPKELVASSTVSLEAFCISLRIDAKEKRIVSTADIPGAYLNTNMDDFVLMWLTGNIVEILCEINPTFRHSVIQEKGTKVLYVQLLKAYVDVWDLSYSGMICT